MGSRRDAAMPAEVGSGGAPRCPAMTKPGNAEALRIGPKSRRTTSKYCRSVLLARTIGIRLVAIPNVARRSMDVKGLAYSNCR